MDVNIPQPLDHGRRGALAAVLDLIIAPSEDGRVPGASHFDVWGYVCGAAPAVVPAIVRDLDVLNEAAGGADGGFAAMPEVERERLLERLRDERPGFLKELAAQTVFCFYQQDVVLEAMGMGARPPYPGGYEVHPGDLSLLDPVRERGPIYRKV